MIRYYLVSKWYKSVHPKCECRKEEKKHRTKEPFFCVRIWRFSSLLLSFFLLAFLNANRWGEETTNVFALRFDLRACAYFRLSITLPNVLIQSQCLHYDIRSHFIVFLAFLCLSFLSAVSFSFLHVDCLFLLESFIFK